MVSEIGSGWVGTLLVADEEGWRREDFVCAMTRAGADCRVNIFDLSSERAVHAMKTSNSVYQLHKVDSPNSVLLEVCDCVQHDVLISPTLD